MTRYVNVEFVHGPKDGDRVIMHYPPPEAWEVPLLPPAQMMCEPPRDYAPTFRRGVYRRRPAESFQVVDINEQAIATYKGEDLVADAMHGKSPMHYVWEGE